MAEAVAQKQSPLSTFRSMLYVFTCFFFALAGTLTQAFDEVEFARVRFIAYCNMKYARVKTAIKDLKMGEKLEKALVFLTVQAVRFSRMYSGLFTRLFVKTVVFSWMIACVLFVNRYLYHGHALLSVLSVGLLYWLMRTE